MEKIDGKLLNNSAVSEALYELGLQNRHRGRSKRKKWTHGYWVKVVDFLSKKYGVSKSDSRKARTNRHSFHW